SPVAAYRVSSRGWVSTLKCCITGVDSQGGSGQVHIFSGPTRTWMGFTYGDKTITANHGARGRRMCGPMGPQGPISTFPDLDIAIYPKVHTSTNLEPCTCSPTEAFLVLKDGSVKPVVKVNDQRWAPLGHLPLNLCRGSSGAPLLCSQSHVVGIFLAVHKVMSTVSGIKVQPMDPRFIARAAEAPPSQLAEAPPVPKEQKIVNLVAPTGSGKSTKIPLEYMRKGWNVLVLNPSVATVLAMEPYMTSEFKTPPNIMAGETTISRGSRLTYCTYGRFLAGESLARYDVMMCDECHSNDSTSILGIGKVLSMLPTTKVKLCILATATPPGCAVTPHPNVDETPLPEEGDLELVKGRWIVFDTLRTGRHLIFMPSKARCEDIAKALNAANIKAVAYYRGVNLGVIPREGNVVVVATDALMTGYTGNFDSVIDSCVSVSEVINFDFDPTFVVSLCSTQSTAITRIQRRGRTGRGKPGIYRYAAPPPGGSDEVPLSSVVAAYDAGIAYFGLTPAEISVYLTAFQQQAGTGTFHASLGNWCDFFASLPPPSHADLHRAKIQADNWEYLTAVAYSLMREARAQPPDDSPRWKGLTGKGEAFLLYRLDGPSNHCKEHPNCERLRACFDEELA
nr:protease-helicase NS3 [Hepacivirus rhabdomysis]